MIGFSEMKSSNAKVAAVPWPCSEIDSWSCSREVLPVPHRAAA